MKKIAFFIGLVVLAVFGAYFLADNTSGGNDNSADVRGYVNTNADSNIRATLVAPNGEGLMVFGNQARISQMVLQTAEGNTGTITMGQNDLPKTFAYGGKEVAFSYDQSKMNLTITGTDGKTETVQENLPKKVSSLIPHAYASDSGVDLNTVGWAMNVIGCSAAISATVLSAGTGSPLAYLGCGFLATRIVTTQAEVGPCESDIVDCTAKGIASHVLGAGLTIKITVVDAADMTAMPATVTLAEGTNIKKTYEPTRTDGDRGEYDFWLKYDGAYNLSVQKNGYVGKTFKVLISNALFRVYDGNTKIADSAIPADKGGHTVSVRLGLAKEAGQEASASEESFNQDATVGSWKGTIKVTNTDLRGNMQSICEQKVLSFKVIKTTDARFKIIGTTGKDAADLAAKTSQSIRGAIDGMGEITDGKIEMADLSGTFQNMTASGTWKRVIQDWSTPSHEEFTICAGTWSASKN